MSNFDRSTFYPRKNIFKCLDLKDILKEYFIDIKIDANFQIDDISSLKYIRNFSILFINKNIKLDKYDFDKIIIITNSLEIFSHNQIKNMILVKDLDECFNIVCNQMYFHEDGIDIKDDIDFIDGSYISKTSIIDSQVSIGKNCFIGRGVKIGPNSIIKNNVVIKNSNLGSNVIISDNTTIGSTGFGFSISNLGSKNIHPHIGIVIIEDDVRIGSNCSIDRGKIDFTFIGSNTMLDNQIHIAHNVIIDGYACIAAQSGVSGSTTIGKNLIAGGQSGFAGHIKIGDNVIVAAKSGVTKNINSKSSVAGYPATDINKWKKNIIKQRKKL